MASPEMPFGLVVAPDSIESMLARSIVHATVLFMDIVCESKEQICTVFLSTVQLNIANEQCSNGMY